MGLGSYKEDIDTRRGNTRGPISREPSLHPCMRIRSNPCLRTYSKGTNSKRKSRKNTAGSFICQKCYKGFSSQAALAQHQKAKMHENPPTKTEPEIGSYTQIEEKDKIIQGLKQEIKRPRRQIEAGQKKRPQLQIFCQACGKLFSKQVSLVQHQRDKKDKAHKYLF